jgi:CubicO group peptidase (beta-lactamase class C family)
LNKASNFALRMLFLLALYFVPGSGSRMPIRPAIALQALLEAKAEQWNTSFSVGIYSQTGGWTAVGGPNDRRRLTPLTPDHRFPVGSVTKPYTCAMVMQAYEKGLIDIDAPISDYVDAILYRLNKTSMRDLWRGDPNVSKITARRLMGMRAGLNEYNDSWYHAITLNEPNHDVTPFEILHRFNKTWSSPPGTQWRYASTGYELLGLALTSVYGYNSWEDFDQMSVFPDQIRSEYNGTTFPGRGLCSADPLVVHQYANTPYKWGKFVNLNYTFTDIRNTSCLNGWVCGNIAATPLDIARFHFDLQSGHIVSNASLAMMNDFYNVSGTIGPHDKHTYGFGLSPGKHTIGSADPLNLTYTIGHNGCDYGSSAQTIIGYVVPLQFGIAVTVNSYMPMNCSMAATKLTLSAMDHDILCPIYDEAIQLVTAHAAPRLNCSLSGIPLPTKCARVLPVLGCNGTRETANCSSCVNSTRTLANLTAAGCTKRDLAHYCGARKCAPSLGLACGALVGDNACMACVENATKTLKRSKTYCTFADQLGFCGPEAVTDCNRTMKQLCGNTVGTTQCKKCATDTTNARTMTSAGCTGEQRTELCDSPALCNSTLISQCSHDRHAANCTTCALRQLHLSECAGVSSQSVVRSYCESCDPYLHSVCASAKSSGNTALCLACTQNKSISSHASYSGCSKPALAAFCGVPTPAPPTPPTPRPFQQAHCNFDF